MDIREYNGLAVKSSAPEALRFCKLGSECLVFLGFLLHSLNSRPASSLLCLLLCRGYRKYITIAFLLTLASTSSLIIEEH